MTYINCKHFILFLLIFNLRCSSAHYMNCTHIYFLIHRYLIIAMLVVSFLQTIVIDGLFAHRTPRTPIQHNWFYRLLLDGSVFVVTYIALVACLWFTAKLYPHVGTLVRYQHLSSACKNHLHLFFLRFVCNTSSMHIDAKEALITVTAKIEVTTWTIDTELLVQVDFEWNRIEAM